MNPDGLLATPPEAAEVAPDPTGYVVSLCEQATHALAEPVTFDEASGLLMAVRRAERLLAFTRDAALGREAGLAATEVLRRLERALAVAVIHGQHTGRVQVRGARSDAPSPEEFLGAPGHRSSGLRVMALIGDEEFDRVVGEARRDGRLARAELLRRLGAPATVAPSEAKPGTKRKRRPLPETAEDAGWELRRATDRVERVLEDSRYGEHREQIDPRLSAHLGHCVEALRAALSTVTGGKT